MIKLNNKNTPRCILPQRLSGFTQTVRHSTELKRCQFQGVNKKDSRCQLQSGKNNHMRAYVLHNRIYAQLDDFDQNCTVRYTIINPVNTFK